MKRKAPGTHQNALVKRQRRDAMYMALPRGRPPARAGYSTVARTRGVYGQGEMKYFDSELVVAMSASTTWTGTNLDPTAVPVAGINTLFCPKQGAGINERIGKSVKLHKIRIRGTIITERTPSVGTGVPAANVRLILLQDMQTNATQLLGADVMMSAASADVNVAVNSPQDTNIFGRVRVLKDKMFTLQDPNIDPSGGADTSELNRNFKWNITFKEPIEVHFNATNGGTIADIVDNSFHLIGNSTTNTPVTKIAYYCRCCYKE